MPRDGDSVVQEEPFEFDGENDSPPATTVDGEGTQGEEEGNEEGAGDSSFEKRLKDTQAWSHKLSEENAELRKQVTAVLQSQASQQGDKPPSEDDINRYAEDLAKRKGAGAAIRELAFSTAQEMVSPLYQKLQAMETRLNTPDYDKLQGRMNTMLDEARSGKLNVDQLLARVARAEDAVEKAGKGLSNRRPDNPARGAVIGSRGGGTPALAPNLQDLPDAESMARVLYAQAQKAGDADTAAMLLDQHPTLLRKGK